MHEAKNESLHDPKKRWIDLTEENRNVNKFGLLGLMFFPDDAQKVIALQEACFSGRIYEELKNSSPTNQISFSRQLLDMKDQGIGFLFDHKEVLSKRDHLGCLAGAIMLRLHIIASWRKSKLNEMEDALRKDRFLNERANRPSLRLLRDMVFHDFNNFENEHKVSLGAYSEKKLIEAWTLMKPVAHFWAADSILREKAAIDIRNRAIENLSLNEREIVYHDVMNFLEISKIFFHSCAAQVPHGETEPIFDKDKAVWFADEIDAYLPKPVWLEFNPELTKKTFHWIRAAKGAAKFGKKTP